MATFSELKTNVARDLRDSSNTTWTTAEIGDLINQGIDALADVYPREIVTTIGTVAANTYTYSAGSFERIYRLDLYTPTGEYRTSLPEGTGDGPNSGWETHGGVVYLPPWGSYTAGDTLRAFGYGRYTQLSADSQTTDLDSAGIWAVRVFAQAEAFGRMIADRAKFQQWQANTNNTDVTAIGLAQLASQARGRWREERNRLRRLRKRG